MESWEEIDLDYEELGIWEYLDRLDRAKDMQAELNKYKELN